MKIELEALEALVKADGRPLTEISRAAGKNGDYLTQLFHNRGDNITRPTADGLCRALGVTLDSILPAEQGEPKVPAAVVNALKILTAYVIGEKNA